MPQVCLTISHPVDGEVSFTSALGKVVVSCRWPFDLDADDWIKMTLRFERRDYDRAIFDLITEGKASLSGDEGEMLLDTRSDGSKSITLRRNGQLPLELYLVERLDSTDFVLEPN